ncbi:hypothetical protein FEP52_03080 [Burkholderia multivorans]|nr:hypothetical protein [Burkholderia multivorans]
MALDDRFPARLAQPREIALHALRAGQDQQVGVRHGAAFPVREFDLRMRAQRIEVGVIADARQRRHDDAQHARVAACGRAARLRGQHVLSIEQQPVQIRQHAEHRLARLRAQPVEARLQQRDIAAEAVDHEAAHARALAVRQACERADEMREHAAAVDVGDQHDRTVDALGKAHVRDVAFAQVDLGRAAGTFDDHRVVTRAQPRVRFEHRIERDRLVVVIRARVQVRARLAVDDHLRAAIAGRLQQHRIEIRMRRDAGGQRLQRLRAADLAAVGRDRAVERHVLRLERRDAHAGAARKAAQARDERALARVGRRALDHQRAARQQVGCIHREKNPERRKGGIIARVATRGAVTITR